MTATHTETRHLAVGPDELVGTLDDVASTLSSLRLAVSTGPLEGWAEVVSACQRVVNAAAAVQDEAVVALCAIETTEDDDGTLRQWHKVPGHVSLDGPAIVSNALDVTAVHAERRVRDAVRLAADGQAGTTTCTGLGALHDAKRSGSLDAYRAGVVAFELEEAPPEIAETVIAALGKHLTRETGPQLRRRCRRLIARISPDLLRQRAKRAREECGLRRWVDQPGVDRWEATFPSEDAAAAWAPIDARAQELMKSGAFDRIERARSQALVDLIAASATVTTIVTLTVPADDPRATTAHRQADIAPAPAVQSVGRLTRDDLVEIANPLGGEPMLVAQSWVDGLLNDLDTRVRTAVCDPVTGALGTDATTDAYRPTAELARIVRQRDGRCRFPGCHVAARFCDLDHVRPWPAGPTSAANLICLCRRHHRIKQRPGWHVTLHTDGTATWSDPTGRTRTTAPVDALHGLVLPAPVTEPDPGRESVDAPSTDDDAVAATRPAMSADAFSSLEFDLEHLLGHTPIGHRARPRAGDPVILRPAHDLLVDAPARTCRTRDHRRRTSRDLDEPPF